MSLPWAVKRMTRDNALALGLEDRGLLRPGYKADLNVIDYDRLTLHCPEPVYDLPGGGRRLIQRAEGYVATVVSGTPVYRERRGDGRAPRPPPARPTGRPARRSSRVTSVVRGEKEPGRFRLKRKRPGAGGLFRSARERVRELFRLCGA